MKAPGSRICLTLVCLNAATVWAQVQESAETAPPQTVLETFRSTWNEDAWTSTNTKGRFTNFMRPLDDSGWAMRMRSIQRLVRAGENAVLDLVKALDSNNEPTRILAAQTLGYVSPHAPVNALQKAITSDASAAVRLYAVDSLGMQGGDFTEFLQSALEKEGNRDVKMHINYALERDGKPVDPSIVRTLRDWNPKTIDSAKVGMPAPDFELEAVNGPTVRLSDYRGKKAVVLVFIYGDT